MPKRLKRILFGAPRDVEDPTVFHSVTLVAFLAWVGLGADGLSSSAYGPEESFKMLGEHTYLALALVVLVAATIFLISYSYAKMIERFPLGGGGYAVTARQLGPLAGVVSGSALLIDYVLTISVSIAAGADAIFSFLPLELHAYRPAFTYATIALLAILNLRGVKESIQVLMPIFLGFIALHVVLIFGTIVERLYEFPVVAQQVSTGFASGRALLGWGGMAALLLRAYSMGAGTYTGIEAVSNGLSIMREPKVATGKRTMVYMAVSLAVMTAGITLGYLLVHAQPVAGKTMNAVLTEKFAEVAGLGQWFVGLVLFSEAALLFVAAQAGFIAGPRVMANMAHDGWMPHRFGTLSDRLTMQDGVVLISSASILTLLGTGGDTHTLVLMYSITVFITFSLAQLSMLRFWWDSREKEPRWRREALAPGLALFVCVGILVLNVYEKFAEGGWVTIVLTGTLVAVCALIRSHYNHVRKSLSRLDDILTTLPIVQENAPPKLDPKAPTAILLVGGYSGLGIHSLLAIQRLFPNYYKNFIFVSVGVVDTATFHGVEAVDEVRERTEASLQKYVRLANAWGLAADYRMDMSVEVVDEAERLCLGIAKEYPRSIVFAGKLVFEREKWFQRLLHNETAFELQRRLQFSGLSAMVLPVRVMTSPAGSA